MAGGRPKIKIDYGIVERLAKVFATQQEIADILDISVRTLQRDDEFCRIYKKHIGGVKESLRRMQLEAAKQGNVTMLVWLGKQYLGQRDKIEQTDITNRELLEQLRDKGEDYK